MSAKKQERIIIVSVAVFLVGTLLSALFLPEKTHADIGVYRQAQVWTTNTTSNPAAGSQATVSQPAISPGRHVLDCVGFSASATTAPALTAVNVNIRDGATGAGTVRHSWNFAVPATTGQAIPAFHVCGLNIVGSNNTAMTVEFSAAVANLFESVNMEGHDTIVNQ